LTSPWSLLHDSCPIAKNIAFLHISFLLTLSLEEALKWIMKEPQGLNIVNVLSIEGVREELRYNTAFKAKRMLGE
jgi:hypothetical protein